MKRRIVVIGNGMVGYKFCAKLKEKDLGHSLAITVFGEETLPAYDRVRLSEYFSGKSAEELILEKKSWYTEHHINLIWGDPIIHIDREAKTVTAASGKTESYDKLVLATGSYPFVPPVQGIDREGIFVYRTIDDLGKIEKFAQNCKSAAVIGGGLLGLEAAKAASDLNLQTHVVEFAPWLMPRQLDETGGMLLKSKIEDQGISVHLNKNTSQIVADGETNMRMEFNDESSLSVDMIIVSAGIRPRDDLAKKTDLEVGPRGGIVVNEQLLTSDPHIYAIGECALYNNFTYGLVAPGYQMADTVAEQLIGNDAAFTGTDMSTKLKLMGVDVSSIGDPVTENDTTEAVTLMNQSSGIYKKLVLEKESRKLLGAILVGDNSSYHQLYQQYKSGKAISAIPESLIAPAGELVEALSVMSDDAQICSCENVSKGQIKSAFSAECTTVDSIKKCTGAGTGCGSCVPLVKDLCDNYLLTSGGTVNNSLCEHFDYTRQELVQIVKAAQITSFYDLLKNYGRGNGCEICKPTIASILASYHNDYVLNKEQMTLQDSNDRFLANIQKNGSYSVVPRVPAGEITPDKLIALGEVAREFNLYTKITGGQRIDLFGALREDLPQIWERLIAAGFESGHAYAKSVRTVKSCVGSTWCRFGVQESVSMALQVEGRYKGIRAPHKIKMAVSGCARECAEAQSKDVGVIATENGWNLYLCGNGGMTPRHATLFAIDLDDETLIAYIDRFLMYYIRTADRLTRTAAWFNKLPGGLKHLRDVIINDSLGICAELEKEMDHLVKTYQCEWSVLLNDPDSKNQFRSFVNSEERDSSIQWVDERGQIAPKISELTGV